MHLTRKERPGPHYPAAARAGGHSFLIVNGLPTVGILSSVPLTQSTFNGFLQGNPPYAQTTAELLAGVTPATYNLLPGNVLRYGTNSSPGSTDMTAAVQAALNQSQEPGGADTYVPPGIYLISSSITIGTGTRLFGSGASNSVILLSSTANANNFVANSASNIVVSV